MVSREPAENRNGQFRTGFGRAATGSHRFKAILTKTQTKCILNVVFISRLMNLPNTQYKGLADRLATLDSESGRMELVDETLNCRGKLQAFMEALPRLDLSVSVRNLILVLLAALMITACGDGNSDYSDGDRDGDNPITDGDGENPDGDQEAIDGDTSETDGDEEITDGDTVNGDGDLVDGDADGDQEDDGDIEDDGDEVPLPCSQFGQEDALTVTHLCSDGQPTVFTLAELDGSDPYAVYNNVSVSTQFEGCGCVLARPACDSQFNEMLTACGIRFVVTEEDGELYDTLHANFTDLFFPGESLSLFTIDLDTDTPIELSSTLAEHQGMPGTLATDFRVVRSSHKAREETEDDYIAYFRDKLPEIENVAAMVNGSTLTVDLNVTDDGHDVFSEAYQNHFSSVQVEFKDDDTGTVYNLDETDIAGQFMADFEPGTYNLTVTIAPEGMDISESEIKRSFSFTIESQDLCEDMTCGDNASCIVDNEQASCECESGFEGNADVACMDIDGCADDPCEEGFECEDVEAPGTGYSCNDIDECEDDPCQTGEICENTEGNYQCNEIDGCSTENNPCDENATCIDNPAPDTGASCECNEGFKGDGETCEEVLPPEVSNLSVDTQGFCVAGRTYPVTFDVLNIEDVDDCTVTVTVRYENGYVAVTPDDPYNGAGTLTPLVMEGNRISCNWTAPDVGGGEAVLAVACSNEDGTDNEETEVIFIH